LFHRRLVSLVTGLALICTIAPAASAAGPGGPSVDPQIVSGRRQLSPTEVRGADVTDQAAGQAVLQKLAADPDNASMLRRPNRVYAFDDQTLVIDPATPVAVFAGRNAEGKTVYEMIPFASPGAFSARAGYAVPPEASWVYNADGSFLNSYNNWTRRVFWTIDAVWNYKGPGEATAHDYFRMYGKMQAGTTTGRDSPWRRAWLELDNQGTWFGSPAEFEIPQPGESIAGPNNIEITIGFGNNIDVSIGKAPVTAGGGVNNTYQGKMSIPTEWWHPVNRNEIASGGINYCRVNEWNGTKVIATRVGIRHNVATLRGGWNILYGMQRSFSGCPST
jgi:hypothetical protein